MYTIKHAARLTGVSEATLRAWERRYAVVTPQRNAAGYRLYDKDSIGAVLAMRRLVDAGWGSAQAADAIRSGQVPVPSPPLGDAAVGHAQRVGRASSLDAMELFLGSAAAMDAFGIERSLDLGFALGSFEHAVETWLFPSLTALGEGWAQGQIDVAGEHMASQAVHRRLSAAFDAAGSRTRGPSVVVGLPPGSLHELGALAFATTAKRRGLNAIYLGSDVPVDSWVAAVAAVSADAAVLAVVTPADRSAAGEVVTRLGAERETTLLLASGGGCGENLREGVRSLPSNLAVAAEHLDEALHPVRARGASDVTRVEGQR
jgi:MerR family transcriptional regulator, light-induced transcriptional regulator